MTTPALAGHPDFFRTFAAARNLLIIRLNEVISADDVRPVVNTVNMHSIGVRAFAITNNFLFKFEWFQDQAATAFITEDRASIRSPLETDMTVTVKGPFMRATIHPTAANSEYTLVNYEATSSAISQTNPVVNRLLVSSPVSVGAGATSTITAGKVWAGPAHWLARFEDGAAWKIRLEAIDENGAVQVIDWKDSVYGLATSQVYLPWATVRQVATNNDAVARNLWSSLHAKPLYP